jgi:hypothetical protein
MLDSMRYMYRCGICRTITTHPSELAAEAEQAGHVERVHDGRWPEDDEISGPHAKPRPPGGLVSGPVRAWLERHDRIIGRALWQWVLCMLAGPAYWLVTRAFG